LASRCPYKTHQFKALAKIRAGRPNAPGKRAKTAQKTTQARGFSDKTGQAARIGRYFLPQVSNPNNQEQQHAITP
jgi:hypothetical protein